MKSENPYFQFCALDYRAQGKEILSTREPEIVLLVLRERGGQLRFLVNPEWRSIVQTSDLAYLESLVQDFLERAKREPEELFAQLSALGVGPLVTYRVGSQVSDYQALEKLCSSFVALDRV